MTNRAESKMPRDRALPAARYRALLVGIRTYPAIPGRYGQPLAGCHNDVAMMRDALLGRGFDDRGIEILVDPVEGCGCLFCREPSGHPAGLPTRDGIVDAMARLLAATASGDVVVFYYSGHGSELSGRGLFTGRRFQTFVPHDSGRGEAENRDITDREIETWIRRMGARTPYLTLIFDCCHSGGVTDLRGEAAAIRRIGADERRQPTAYASGLRQSLEHELPLKGDERRSAIVLSACVAKELSSETEADGRKQGLFTHHLTQVLARPAVAGQAWADLFPEVARGVTGENLAQHPRRGGNGPIFEPGPIDLDDIDPPDVIELAKLAVVIGIDYQLPEGEPARHFPPLLTPQRDAQEVARVLAEEQGYEVVGLSDRHPGPLLGKKATRRRIHKLLHRLAGIKARIRRETAVVIYFAGHGVVRTTDDGEHKGHLVPWDADPDDPSTWLPMSDLRDQLVEGIRDPARLERLEQRGTLSRLASRHVLLILDCCFGGAMAYDFFRGSDTGDRPIHYSEYKRFVEGTAWQLLTSASFNQQALDRDPQDPEQPNSPFAQALIEGLSGDRADTRPDAGRSDHIVTATELHQHIDRRLKGMGIDVQTPGLVDLRPRDGQFIFSVPGFAPTPLPDPALDPGANPWRGRQPYDQGEDGGAELFCGRESATLDLLASFLACRHPAERSSQLDGDATGEDARADRHLALAVVGPSGSGVTSLLRAGLLDLLAGPATARRRLRSWLRRAGQHHYLAARQDLKALRGWVDELGLQDELTSTGTALAEERIADRVRTWAVEAGLLDPRGQIGDGAADAGRSRVVRESLGVPSFDLEVQNSRELGWLRRLDLLSLVDQPALLVQRLRLWSERKGLADFLSVPDRALPGLVGRWRVVTRFQEIPEAGDDAGGAGHATLWLCDPLSEPAATITPSDWRSLIARRDLQIIAAVRADSLTRDAAVAALMQECAADDSRLWRLHHVERPTRDELWRVIQEPAAARVLFFEPEELVETLVEEAADLPAPLSLLSMTLAHMVAQAWHRRGAADRQLQAVDLAPGESTDAAPPATPIATLLGRRAEALYRRLSARDPALRRTFRAVVLRAVSLDDGWAIPRSVRWREVEAADAAERRRLQKVLPALIDERLMVASEHQLELACDGLLAAWPRARRWLRFLQHVGKRPQALWRQTLAWQESGGDAAKLRIGDHDLSRLLALSTLNRLEWTFVTAGEVARRAADGEALGALALRHLEDDWTRSAQAAVELTTQARDTMSLTDRVSAMAPEWAPPTLLESFHRLTEDVRVRARQLAEQTLRDVLAATPLALALPWPTGVEGPIEGLSFEDGESLSVRVGPIRLTWSTAEPAASPRREDGADHPRAGAGEALPARSRRLGPEALFPPVPPRRPPHSPRGPHAQSGYDRKVRYFVPGQLMLPPFLRRPPVRLLGHREVPTFLAFSPPDTSARQPRWLATGANPSAGKAELRLWAIDDHGAMPGEPHSTFVPKIDQALEDFGFSRPGHRAGARASDSAARVTRLDRLPVTLTADGTSWRLESVAEDGSSLELEPPESATSLRLEIPNERSASDGMPGLREILLGPEGRWLAVITRRGWAGLWSLPDLTLRWWSADGVATLAWGPSGSARDRVAIGHLDGRALLAWWTPESETVISDPARSVLLPTDLDGFAVRALSFDPPGRRLAVERQSMYEPFDRYLGIYQLGLDQLADLARRHAGPLQPVPGSGRGNQHRRQP